MILHLILIVTIVHKAMNDECVNVYRIDVYKACLSFCINMISRHTSPFHHS